MLWRGVLIAGLIVGAACSGDAAGFCERARDFETSDLAAGDGDLETRIVEALETLDGLIEVAPEEIVGSLVRIRDDVESFVRGTGTLDARFELASRRVQEYLEAECGDPQ